MSGKARPDVSDGERRGTGRLIGRGTRRFRGIHRGDRRAGRGRQGHDRPRRGRAVRLRPSRHRPALPRGRRGRCSTAAIRSRRRAASSPADLERGDLRIARGRAGGEPGRGDAGGARGARGLPADFARREGGAVLDGRDIGTVICPEAEVKLFVTADDVIRAHRRWLELGRPRQRADARRGARRSAGARRPRRRARRRAAAARGGCGLARHHRPRYRGGRRNGGHGRERETWAGSEISGPHFVAARGTRG